jgi:superfamily II DNA or RNA helicase
MENDYLEKTMNNNSVLILENNFCQLVTTNNKLKESLWDCLRFRERNYFHSRLYKQRLWDGYREFFKKENGMFLTGLLPEVMAALKHFDIQYNVDDKRVNFEFQHNSIDEGFLNQWLPNGMQPVKLHDYQVELINQAIKHRRGVVFAPTSAGKSFIMVGIIKALPPNTPTLILQNRVGLAEQNYAELKNWGVQNLGRLWGGAVEPNLITVASVQSVAKMERALPKIRALIVDEIHDMMSKTPMSVYKKLKGAGVRIAVSATPFKFGERDKVQKHQVKGYFGPVLKIKSTDGGILTTSELQQRGILSSSKCKFFPVNEPNIPHDIYIDAVTRGIAENKSFHDMVVSIAHSCSGRTLILVDRIAHGDALNAMLPGSLWVQGKDTSETRGEVIKQLQKSKKSLIAIATQQIFNTGINVFVHNLINAAGGQADHQIIQRMGRGLRTANDKSELNYYDFVFSINPYLSEHSEKRIRILRDQGHTVDVMERFEP